MGKHVFAVSKAIVGMPDGPVRLYENEVWAADDPVVKAHPDAFAAAPVKVRRSRDGYPAPAAEPEPVEDATAEPGAKRTTTRRKS